MILVPPMLNNNLAIHWRIEDEIAFLFYNTVIGLHSHSYSNYKQESKMGNERVQMGYFIAKLV